MSTPGFTLVEMLITLSILGVLAGVATMAVRQVEKPQPNDPYHLVAESLRVAVAQGRAITVPLLVDNRPAFATVFPDGSVVADSTLHLDRLAGRGPRGH